MGDLREGGVGHYRFEMANRDHNLKDIGQVLRLMDIIMVYMYRLEDNQVYSKEKPLMSREEGLIH